jgi:hypothetical protein
MQILRLCFTDSNSRWWMNMRSQSWMQMSSNDPQFVVVAVKAAVYLLCVPGRIEFFSGLSEHWVSYYSRSVICTKEKIKFALLIFQRMYYGLSQNSLEATGSVLHIECQVTSNVTRINLVDTSVLKLISETSNELMQCVQGDKHRNLCNKVFWIKIPVLFGYYKPNVYLQFSFCYARFEQEVKLTTCQ